MSETAPLHALPANEAAAAIREGVLSASDYVGACLQRIRDVDPQVQAWAFLDEEYAMKQARALDEHRAQGRSLGRLHGIPVGIKDIVDTDDMATEFGSPIHAGRQPALDATIVSRLRAQGAVILGKTVTTEFATYQPGKTRNPWNPDHTPGGSSSGSAAAVAAGMVPLAIGTQTNGSVIRPASFCGVFGFKPSFGLIPRTGVLCQSRTLDQIGAFGRTLDDVALLTEVLIGYDDEDPDTRPAPAPRLLRVSREEPPLPPRLAFVGTPIWDEISATSRGAFDELRDVLGDSLPELTMSETYRGAWDLHRTIHQAELAHHLRLEYERGKAQLSDSLREQIEGGQRVTAVDYLRARDRARTLYEGLELTLEEYDAVVTPAAHGAAPAGLDTTGSPAFCTIWTLFGVPAISLPLLRAEDGLPIGVQLVGKRGDDARRLRTARWLAAQLSDAANPTNEGEFR